jgi:imidazolonepropionase-like amidohydrolase
MCAGLAHNAGLDYEEAWKAITIAAANLTGIGDRVGSLEVGKDGDLVIWTADPMTVLAAQSACTIVDGKIVYQA